MAEALAEGRRLPEYEALLSSSIERLPFTMSNPLARAEQSRSESDYKEALTHLLDFFEMSVQWLNCYLLARMAPLVAGADAQARKAMERVVRTIDMKRPLSFGDHVTSCCNL